MRGGCWLMLRYAAPTRRLAHKALLGQTPPASHRRANSGLLGIDPPRYDRITARGRGRPCNLLRPPYPAKNGVSAGRLHMATAQGNALRGLLSHRTCAAHVTNNFSQKRRTLFNLLISLRGGMIAGAKL